MAPTQIGGLGYPGQPRAGIARIRQRLQVDGQQHEQASTERKQGRATQFG